MCVETGLKGGRAWWIAPSYKVANVGWRGLRQMGLQLQDQGFKVRIRDTPERIVEFGDTGGSAQVRSADDPQSLRGEGLDLAVFDEAAFVIESAWTEAIRPALADKEGKALFISTPKGRNWFWRLWQTAMSQQDPEWMGWQFPTSSNPHIKATEIAAAKRSLPEQTFLQEFMAEFVEDAGAVFRGVTTAATAVLQTEAIPGHDYAFGVDWAKHQDFTAISVMDATLKSLVYSDRFNQIDYSVQRGRLKTLYERFRPYKIIAESNAMGDPIVEQLFNEGLPVEPFRMTNSSKKAIIDSLVLAFERQEIKILPDPTLIAELQAFEVERLPSGLLRYNAPHGIHDDTVISLALAWQECAVERWVLA
jgi:hypothetical protein